MCRLLKITRSVYYASLKRSVDISRLHLRSRLRELHQQSRGSAGNRTLSLLMRRSGYNVGRWLARRLMQECGLESRQPGKHRYRNVGEETSASPNLLKRQFTPTQANRVWSGNISYIKVSGGWCYPVLVIDLYSRRIVGLVARCIAGLPSNT